jgi:hypothetical protein
MAAPKRAAFTLEVVPRYAGWGARHNYARFVHQDVVGAANIRRYGRSKAWTPKASMIL